MRARVVHNGVTDTEFAMVSPAPDATDLVFVGELRHLKGIDVLLDAVAILHASGRPVSLTVVGQGSDRAALEAQADRLGLAARVRFAGARPAREAFSRGRLLVVPSRAESLPYIVLEAAAAALPVIATAVGGIAEIFGPDADALIPAGNPRVLADAIQAALASPQETADRAIRLQSRVREHFSVARMTGDVLAAYSAARP
jgi:glycosyltransferase involved in cell wall biosynthesis